MVCCPEKIPKGIICFPDQAWCPHYQPPVYEDEYYEEFYDEVYDENNDYDFVEPSNGPRTVINIFYRL